MLNNITERERRILISSLYWRLDDLKSRGELRKDSDPTFIDFLHNSSKEIIELIEKLKN